MSRKRKNQNRAKRFVPRLEQLEHRMLLTAISLTQQGRGPSDSSHSSNDSHSTEIVSTQHRMNHTANPTRADHRGGHDARNDKVRDVSDISNRTRSSDRHDNRFESRQDSNERLQKQETIASETSRRSAPTASIAPTALITPSTKIPSLEFPSPTFPTVSPTQTVPQTSVSAARFASPTQLPNNPLILDSPVPTNSPVPTASIRTQTISIATETTSNTQTTRTPASTDTGRTTQTNATPSNATQTAAANTTARTTQTPTTAPQAIARAIEIPPANRANDTSSFEWAFTIDDDETGFTTPDVDRYGGIIDFTNQPQLHETLRLPKALNEPASLSPFESGEAESEDAGADDKTSPLDSPLADDSSIQPEVLADASPPDSPDTTASSHADAPAFDAHRELAFEAIENVEEFGGIIDFAIDVAVDDVLDSADEVGEDESFARDKALQVDTIIGQAPLLELELLDSTEENTEAAESSVLPASTNRAALFAMLMIPLRTKNRLQSSTYANPRAFLID